MTTQKMPTGVKILAILAIASGIYTIFALIFALTSVIDKRGFEILANPAVVNFAIYILILIGISFVIVWGFLKGKLWAWIIILIYATLSLIMGLNSTDYIEIIIDIVIVYYLFRPNVRTYFKKSKQVL